MRIDHHLHSSIYHSHHTHVTIHVHLWSSIFQKWSPRVINGQKVHIIQGHLMWSLHSSIVIFKPVVSVSFFLLLDSASLVSPDGCQHDDHVDADADHVDDDCQDDDQQQDGHRWRSWEKQRHGLLVPNWRYQTWRKTSRSHFSLFWYSRIFNVDLGNYKLLGCILPFFIF